MKRTRGWVTISFLFGFWALTLASAADPKPAPSKPSPSPSPSTSAAQPLKGQLIKIEGDVYVVKDAAGKEIRLRVNQETVLQADLHVGDKIDAEVLPDGRAATVLRALQ